MNAEDLFGGQRINQNTQRCPVDKPIYVLLPSKGAAVPSPWIPITNKRLRNQNFPDDSVDAKSVSQADIRSVRLKE